MGVGEWEVGLRETQTNADKQIDRWCCRVLQCRAVWCSVIRCAVSMLVSFPVERAPGASTDTGKSTKHILHFAHLRPLFWTAKKTDSTDTFLSLPPPFPWHPLLFLCIMCIVYIWKKLGMPYTERLGAGVEYHFQEFNEPYAPSLMVLNDGA